MDALPRERPAPSNAPTAGQSEDPTQAPFAPRLRSAIVMLGIAVAAHVWLVRAPEGPRPVVAESSAPSLALSERPQPRTAPRSTLAGVLAEASAATPERVDAPSAGESAVAASGAATPRHSSGAPATDFAIDGDRRSRNAGSPVAGIRPVPVPTTGTSAASAEPVAAMHAASPPEDDVPRAEGMTVASAGVHRTGTTAAPRTASPRLPVMSSGVDAELAELVGTMAGRWTAPDWEKRPSSAATPEPVPEAPLASAASDLREQEAIVLQVLDEFAKAYERLDVQAAKAVWPTLDTRALRRAFHQLDAQQLRFTTCGVSISGQAANALCQGDATYHPKVGGRPMHLPREWTFSLSRHEDGWQIVKANLQ